MRKLLVILLLLLLSKASYGLWQFGGEIDLMDLPITSKAEGLNDKGDYGGVFFGGYGHYAFSLGLFKLGVGPFASIGTLDPSLESGVTSSGSKFLKYGGEVFLSFEKLSFALKPFIRIGYGKESFEETQTGPISGVSNSFTIETTGFTFHFIFGSSYFFTPNIGVFAQVGIARGEGDSKLTKWVANGVDISFIQLLPITASYSGNIQIGFGLVFRLEG